MEQLTDYIVMKSNAGFYIGRKYFEKEYNIWLPYDRISAEYWETKEEAEEALETGKFTSKVYS